MSLSYPQVTHQIGGNTSGVTANVSTGTYVLAGGNNITLSQAGNAVTISGPNTSPQTAFVLSDSNGVSFGTNGSTVTATVRTDYLTTAMASNRGSDFVQATATIAGTSISGTIASNVISLSVGPYITTAMASNRGSDFVQANAAFAGTSASGTIASNGISVSIGPYITTAMASNRGSDFVQANAAFAGTNASGTIASNGISVSVAAPGAGGGIAAAAGTQTGTSGTVLFENSNGITFGMSGSTRITASHNGLTTARASNDAVGLNTAQSNVTWTVNSAGLSLNAGGYCGTGTTFNGANLSGSMTVNSNGVQLSISAAAPGGGGGGTISFWRNIEAGSAASPVSALGVGARPRTFMVQPLEMDFKPFAANMTVSTLMMPINLSGSTATMSASYSSTFSFGFYTNNAGTLSLVNSASTAFGSGGAATNNSTLFAGNRWLTIHSSQFSSSPVFSAGVQYWWAWAYSTQNVSNQTFNVWGQNIFASNTTFAGTVGAASVANNATRGGAPFYGNYTATSASPPTAIQSGDLSKQNATAVLCPMLIFNNVNLTF